MRWAAVRVESAKANPDRMTISMIGSARSETASGLSSRSATNTARGDWSTSTVRSHQSDADEPTAGRPPSLSVARLTSLDDGLAVRAEVLDLVDPVVLLRDRRLAVLADRRVSSHVTGDHADDEQRQHQCGKRDVDAAFLLA